MRYLLDTHVVLWFFDEMEKLSESAFAAILGTANEKYVSIVSAWEVAIKIGTGKLHFTGGVSEFFTMINENGFELLPITENHIKTVEALLPIHKDPFDRLLISTALVENLTLITADDNVRKYDVPWTW